MTAPYDPYSLFASFEPAAWNPSGAADGEVIYSLRRDHGVRGTYRLHNPNDEINEGRGNLDKVIIEYRIESISYPLYTVGDLLSAPYAFDNAAWGNIVGDIAERIARRVTKYWLKHINPLGKTGGIFDRRFNPKERDDFIITNTQQYVLKIRKYPNLVILKKTGRGKYGYENIKELDGLFDYRYFRQRSILVLESKLEKLTVNADDLLRNLFEPLATLFPDAHFCYLVFTDRNSIYQKRGFERRRQIKQFPLKLYRRLREAGIATLFFSFGEQHDDFERMREHLVTQYRAINRMGVTLRGRTVIRDRELMIFDAGETPHLKLIKDPRSGTWREVKLTHKRRRK
ncbi:MAG TPA: hypothetical protein VKF42_00170 [Chitinivibrionales bacterium]|jgi:hypothetical protein|nr:hypothetical protein [Chitinivibrionales bacterium]